MAAVSEIREFHKRGRVLIVMDDGRSFPLYRSEAEGFGLEVDGEISDSLLCERIIPLLKKRARDRSLYILARSAKASSEIRARLKRDGYPADVIDETVGVLCDLGYLDDLKLARDFVDGRRGLKSASEIRRALLQKGIDADIADEALCGFETDEIRALKALVAKKALSGGLEGEEKKQKLIAQLRRKGFAYRDIAAAIEEQGQLDITSKTDYYSSVVLNNEN